MSSRPRTDCTHAIWLKVVVIGFKVRTCKLCDGLSTDHSPLNVSLSDAVDCACDSEHQLTDQFGGLLPWAKYRLVRDERADGKKGVATARTPDGKLCLICLHVFRALGACFSCPKQLRLPSAGLTLGQPWGHLGPPPPGAPDI